MLPDETESRRAFWREREARWAFGALLVSLGIHVWHFFALPVKMSWDGIDYLALSKLFGTSTDWRYYRTPGYPLALRGATDLFGANALTVQLPNFIYGFGGIALLAVALLQLRRPRIAATVVLLLTFFPPFIAYEHSILTETGSFFFIAAQVCLLTTRFERWWLKPLCLALLLALGFYHRMTLLYFSPIAALICAVELWFDPALSHRRERWRRAAAAVLAIILIPWLAAQPFNRALYGRPDSHYVGLMTIYGLLKQAVPAPDDPLVVEERAAYETAIANSSAGGSLDWGGIPQLALLPFDDLSYSRLTVPPLQAFLGTVGRNPWRYTTALGRGLVYFAGAHSAEDENGDAVREVIVDAPAGSRFFGNDHPDYESARRTYARAGTDSVLARMLTHLVWIYRQLLRLGCVATAVGLIVSVLRRDRLLFTFCAVPAFLIGFHVLLLITINRYAMPAYPLVLANLVIVPAWLRNRTHPSPGGLSATPLSKR